MIIDPKLKTDMEITAKKMKRLDSLNQIIIASKIDALYERQMLDEAEKNRLSKREEVDVFEMGQGSEERSIEP